jgi:hypothetical protein
VKSTNLIGRLTNFFKIFFCQGKNFMWCENGGGKCILKSGFFWERKKAEIFYEREICATSYKNSEN